MSSLKRKVHVSSAGNGLKKRKRVVLTITEKIKICELAAAKTPYSTIAKKFGIGRSTIVDIRKQEQALRDFQRKAVEMNLPEARSMKTGDFEDLDEALYLWFKQKREQNMDVSGDLLMEQAKIFYEKMYPGNECLLNFSHGFLWRFCQRHKLRHLVQHGEKLSANKPVAEDYAKTFPDLVSEYSHDQIFNCDETGLNFRRMPGKSLVSSFEGRAEGRKKSKDQVTINACANVTGSIKLPLLVIGKSARPRCFRDINISDLNVTYRSQKNAWVDSALFLDWFQTVFVPIVQQQLRDLGQEPKALLVLDNCPAHPDASQLVSPDNLVTATYLPPNVTSLVQPMDQGVLEMLKRKYRKSLVRDLLLSEEEEDVTAYLKKVNMLTIAEKSAAAWDEIPATTPRRSWAKLLPIPEADAEDCDAQQVNDPTSIATDLSSLGYNVTADDIIQCDLEDDGGYERMDDDAIVDLVQQPSSGRAEESNDDDDEEEEAEEEVVVRCPVSNGQAMEAFNLCLTWLRHQRESSPHNLATLTMLRDLAASKRVAGLRQSRISNFFQSQ